jgi:uncharacterized protein YcfJ
MLKIAFIAAICLGAAACTPTTTGTVAGATTGALVGGPVGAVVGAGVGAVAGASAGAASGASQGAMMVAGTPGRCYVTDSAGNIAVDRRGRPVTTRC